ncbi:prolactin regulatory element-binding protein, partial [Lecanoromycetidae sp. Uapishka_2]
MSSSIPSAQIKLSYPIYGADFDPKNSGFLLVGGGGGEGRSGVANKITLLDTSRKHDISEVVDINLSSEEDSVTSLAFAQSTEQWATAFAGINSSTKDQQAGKNEHLRSFLLEYPPRRRKGTNEQANEKEIAEAYKGDTKTLGKASLFKSSTAAKKETFQRVLRLSKKKPGNTQRLGAVATGLAPEGEIVLFAADTSRPGPDDIRGRIQLGEKEEAADVDVVALESGVGQEEGKFRVAYCTDYEVYVADVSYSYNYNPDNLETQKIHSTALPDTSGSSTGRPKFRCVRFLTPQVLIVLQNQPSGQGATLLLLEISGMITLRKKLHKKIKSATALAVAHIDASSPSEIDQQAIAVAGADTSVTILTVDRFTSHPQGRIKFRPHSFHPNVHPTSITALAFSTFTPPTTVWKDTPPQYLKLASTSIANTCVVYTLPLSPYPSVPKPDTPARYVLTAPKKSTLATNTVSALVALLAIAIGAFFLQAFTEIRGGTPEYLSAKGWLNEQVHDWIARPYMFEDVVPAATAAAKEQISLASEAVASPFSTATDAAGGAVDPALEEFQASLASAQDELETSLSLASEAAKTPLSQAFKAVETPLYHASEAIGDKLGTATDAAGSSLSKVSEAIETPLGRASNAAKDSVSKASKVVETPLSNASEAAASSVKKASQAVETPLSKASEAAASNLSKASDAVSSPLIRATEAVGSAASAVQAKLGLRDLLARRNIGSDNSDNANDGTDIIVRHSPAEGGETALSAELRDASELVQGEHKAKKWEELTEHEKKTWKQRLIDAGDWVAEEGEAVLQGVFFSGIANAVGNLAG